jgi:hypothetical protein
MAMRTHALLHPARPRRLAVDGWLGTPELPGYRAFNAVARLHDLPKVDPDHLYFDLLLLDENGRIQDNHSGPCPALERGRSVEDRARFVRVAAELVRHASADTVGLAVAGPALRFIRERGVETASVVVATQMLDAAFSEAAVVESLIDVLELSLGAEEAERALRDIVHRLARLSIHGPFVAHDALGLAAQVWFIVRALGKARARRHLRQAIDFDLVASAEMFGV